MFGQRKVNIFLNKLGSIWAPSHFCGGTEREREIVWLYDYVNILFGVKCADRDASEKSQGLERSQHFTSY